MKNMRFLLNFILSLQKSVVTLHRFNGEHGRLAQLVQSICLTSRGSGVRIPQRPLKPPLRRLFYISTILVRFPILSIFYYRVEILASPNDKILNERQQRLAEIGDRVFDPRRHIWIKLTVKNTVGV